MSDKFQLSYPKKVRLADISVREGLQHEERFIPVEAKLFYVEESILAGFKRLEISNFANPAFLRQFGDYLAGVLGRSGAVYSEMPRR